MSYFRKCSREGCNWPARAESGNARKHRLCDECYGHCIIKQAQTSRMERCACGNVAAKGQAQCGRCARENSDASDYSGCDSGVGPAR
jgi:hypothetical protein